VVEHRCISGDQLCKAVGRHGPFVELHGIVGGRRGALGERRSVFASLGEFWSSIIKFSLSIAVFPSIIAELLSMIRAAVEDTTRAAVLTGPVQSPSSLGRKAIAAAHWVAPEFSWVI